MLCFDPALLLEASGKRISRRAYQDTAMDPALSGLLLDAAEKVAQASGLRAELVLENGSVFRGPFASYGMFTGVRNYIALAADKNMPFCREKAGYFGQQLMLYAVSLGLGTCWVGASYNKRGCPVSLKAGEELICVITVGPVAESMAFRENMTYKTVHRGGKSVAQLLTHDAQPPAWVLAGMEQVRSAPSAMNAQPVAFAWKDGALTASVPLKNPFQPVDLGIAKLHFELGAGQGEWDFGTPAAFRFEQTDPERLLPVQP